MKALKKAGYLGDMSASQAYKQLDVNKDGVADPYETARLFGQTGLPFGYSTNPYAGYGLNTAYPGPTGYPGYTGAPAIGGLNAINGLHNYQNYQQPDYHYGAPGMPGGFGGYGGY